MIFSFQEELLDIFQEKDAKIKKGFVLVEQEELKKKKQMEYFIDKALAYNSIAKSRKKKKK